MPIVRLNHAVLFVSDVERSVAFYRDVLGFTPIADMAELPGRRSCRRPAPPTTTTSGCSRSARRAGPSQAGRSTVGLYHLAWEVDTLDELGRVRDALAAAGALVGSSDHGTTKSLYGRDPDGLEFEIVWLIPADRLDDAALGARSRIGVLDLEKEKARYGADTVGGVGISSPARA